MNRKRDLQLTETITDTCTDTGRHLEGKMRQPKTTDWRTIKDNELVRDRLTERDKQTFTHTHTDTKTYGPTRIHSFLSETLSPSKGEISEYISSQTFAG